MESARRNREEGDRAHVRQIEEMQERHRHDYLQERTRWQNSQDRLEEEVNQLRQQLQQMMQQNLRSPIPQDGNNNAGAPSPRPETPYRNQNQVRSPGNFGPRTPGNIRPITPQRPDVQFRSPGPARRPPPANQYYQRPPPFNPNQPLNMRPPPFIHPLQLNFPPPNVPIQYQQPNFGQIPPQQPAWNPGPRRQGQGNGGGDGGTPGRGTQGSRTPGPGPRRGPTIDRRNLKLPKFKGKDVESWCSMVEDFAEAMEWTEIEKRLHIKANLDDWIRSMFADCEDLSSDEMLHQLTMRFGVTMSHPEVHNELIQIVRKSNESLHELADRVRNTARKAHMPGYRRQHIMRDVFFTALRPNKELQHYVDRYDDLREPNMMNTLALALDWEMKHGTQHSSEKVRNVKDESSESKNAADTSDRTTDSDSTVNKVDYIDMKELSTKEAKLIAKQQNETTRLLRKWAYSTLDDDKSKFTKGRQYNKSDSRSTSRSSGSSWRSRPRSRSRTRRFEKRDKSYKRSSERKWKKYDKYEKRKKSGDRKYSKKDYKNRRDKYKKRNRSKERIENVQDESDDSRTSRSTTDDSSGSESESTE